MYKKGELRNPQIQEHIKTLSFCCKRVEQWKEMANVWSSQSRHGETRVKSKKEKLEKIGTLFRKRDLHADAITKL